MNNNHKKIYFGLFFLVFAALFLAACNRNRNDNEEPYEGYTPPPQQESHERPQIPAPEMPAPEPYDDRVYMPIPEWDPGTGHALPADQVEIMVFEGQPIYANELIFIASIMGLDPLTYQDEAAAQLIEFLTVIDRANRHGLGLTDEERANILPSAQNTIDLIGLSGLICDERLIDFYSIGSLLTPLLNYYIYNYVPNVANYPQELNAFANANADFLAHLEIMYIISIDLDLMRYLHIQLQEGTVDFEEMVREHSIFYLPADGVTTLSMYTFEEIFNLYDRDRSALYGLLPGEISHIFSVGEFFFLIYVTDRQEATNAEIEEAFINYFIAQRRIDSIDDLIDGWIAEANYIIR